MSTDRAQNGHQPALVDRDDEDDEVRVAKRRKAITSAPRKRDQQIQQNTNDVDEMVPLSQAQVAFAELASAITGRDISRGNNMVESAQIVLDEFEKLRDTVDDFEGFMESYGVEKPRNQDEAWVKIVDLARNVQDNPNHCIQGSNEVSLFIEDLEKATGYSDRHCSDLIEEYGKDKQGTRWIKHEPASAANNHNATKKQLVLDLNVWGEDA